ncbi:uncharacterized protein N7446_000985 [Penicillium canescens]|uniref:3-hydroxyacyl-CoA dehydrogenase n=1 Tax=Penicillium canescens TaxID=5083 RepID=A0AAD6N4K7_PENCN|nr:uncharacterized protein N7446_000985 [Penicillium canescens]KAJ6029952.1 hypothetical protein N7460_010218 [Penicillium canescens]KAJ6060330.1 hypothetical protein N7444_002184 [Penicillium canescens]KAJ6078049.1 hypothetical protein N7446_000985 [Penicillium canescens]
MKLYLLDAGIKCLDAPFDSGRIIVWEPGTAALHEIVGKQRLPDGIIFSRREDRLYWTNMGIPDQNDGSILSCNPDGSDVQQVLAPGKVHTPKQLKFDHDSGKLYFADREGLRVMRCNTDGSELETLIQAGDWQMQRHKEDKSRWCVGVAISTQNGKLYWSQKGPSKGSAGRIFAANISIPTGYNAENRPDITCLVGGLPEPVDLHYEEQSSTLYWTDRGELPLGNTLNYLNISDLQASGASGHHILAYHFNEAIGLTMNYHDQAIYVTDLGGGIYRCSQDGSGKRRMYVGEESAFTGITMSNEV